jgi:hypothetical protein
VNKIDATAITSRKDLTGLAAYKILELAGGVDSSGIFQNTTEHLNRGY